MVLEDLENPDLLQVQQDQKVPYPRRVQMDLVAPQDLVFLCLQWGLLVLRVQIVLADQPDQGIRSTHSDPLDQLDQEVHWVLPGPADLENLKFQQVQWIR